MKHYVVRRNVTEIYDIIIDADSEENALLEANGIDLDKWIKVATTTNSIKVAKYAIGAPRAV